MRSRWVLAAAVACAVASGTAGAEPTTLIFATVDPPNFPMNVLIHHPWAARVTAASQGTLQVEARDGPVFANQGNFYNRVLDDVAQLAWGCQRFVGGKFPLSDIVGLPFETGASRESSVAFWRLYKTGLLDAEYDEIKPLWLVSLPQAVLHFRKAPQTPADLRGLKVLAGGKIQATTIGVLGGSPISLRVAEFYEALQRGTADGAIIPWSGALSFKLDEVTSYHIDTALGGVPCMVFMAKKKYDALPEAARKAIDDNSGEAQSRRHGAEQDDEQLQARAAIKARANAHTVADLSPAQARAWRSALEPATEQWTRSVPNGAAVLARFREIIAEVRAGR
ncbi:MAG TPA: TRAP transporter substrate-binding protein [Stellaceae bacterium]|nr:TRAP transporter substrate-binding protein [Stellaceae bacterium]